MNEARVRKNALSIPHYTAKKVVELFRNNDSRVKGVLPNVRNSTTTTTATNDSTVEFGDRIVNAYCTSGSSPGARNDTPEGIMGAARQRKLAGLQPRPQLPSDINPMVFEVDGTTVIMLIDFNGKKPSPQYHYGTLTGKVTKTAHACTLGEWIGEIHVSPNINQRMWIAAKNLFNSFEIPTEPKALKQFINTRGEKGPWYRIGSPEEGIQGSIYLPNVLAVTKAIDKKSSKDTAIVASAVVAPKHVGKGFGTMLHVLAAGYFKQRGFKFLSSDIVGFNTDSEVAVWNRLAKIFSVESHNESGFSTPRALEGLSVIDDKMAKFLSSRMSMYINGKAMTLEEISNTKFPQFEMDLTDKRVPILVGGEKES